MIYGLCFGKHLADSCRPLHSYKSYVIISCDTFRCEKRVTILGKLNPIQKMYGHVAMCNCCDEASLKYLYVRGFSHKG